MFFFLKKLLQIIMHHRHNPLDFICWQESEYCFCGELEPQETLSWIFSDTS
jgi:hypothetical protein